MEPGAAELYDQALLGILQHVGNVQDFLRVLFGFLYRKTDFYRLLRHPTDRMGFPPGAAQALVLQVFQNFDRMARQDDEKRRKELEEKMRRKEAEAEAAAPELEVEVNTTDAAVASGGPAEPQGQLRDLQKVVPGSREAAEPPALDTGAAQTPREPPPLPRRQEQFQRNPDSYNGAVRENYTWSQDYTDLELKVPVPKHVVKGRQVSLNKAGEYWWSAVLEGEEPIDIDQINKERSMATVGEEEHAVLDRLTFDYHQKLQGKPQSHELKVHEMLKKGWDAEGSPFRGQRFDPAMFNISPGAVQF
ncbi:nudC domain-containing protein 3 isoform X2 [Myotis daubentonii]|uniref:nudC domain-containing protein 3 isoform X2 n=1 Tax=Myotis daubentonii TaxID=98922 RepID=UPI002873575D|nr:nudC domain-containing protein 3 isoform X2 [Myotis daubentonii]